MAGLDMSYDAMLAERKIFVQSLLHMWSGPDFLSRVVFIQVQS